jgi:hypothetical protein
MAQRVTAPLRFHWFNKTYFICPRGQEELRATYFAVIRQGILTMRVGILGFNA